MFKQCNFYESDLEDDQIHAIGGIAHFNGETPDTIDYIICGCCGGTFEPEDVVITEIYDEWVDLTEFIIGT